MIGEIPVAWLGSTTGGLFDGDLFVDKPRGKLPGLDLGLGTEMFNVLCDLAFQRRLAETAFLMLYPDINVFGGKLINYLFKFRYCNSFLTGQQCIKKDCPYLHEKAKELKITKTAIRPNKPFIFINFI